MNTSPSEQFGIGLACAFSGIEPSKFAEEKAFAETVRESDETKRLICKIASNMYAECGKLNHFEYHLYDQLSKSASWDPVYDQYFLPVVGAFASVFPAIELEQQEKVASALLNKGVLANLVGRGVAATPSVVKTLAALGVAGGAGLGTLGWFLNRDSQEDDQKLEAMQSRVDAYNRITGEISDQLSRSTSVPVTKTASQIIAEALL